MTKGALTRTRILDQALVLASRLGLDGLTLGVLAETLGLSKSGLYAHFRSKEALVLAVLEHTKQRFVEHCVPYFEGRTSALDELRAHFAAWLDWIALADLPAGCPILGASFEVEDLDGPTRDYIVTTTRGSRLLLCQRLKRAVDSGELQTDLPIEQVAFEIRGFSLSFHIEHRLLRDKSARKRADAAFESLLARYMPPAIAGEP